MIPIYAVINPDVAICFVCLSFVLNATTAPAVACAMLEQRHPGPKILSYPRFAICITPSGATPLCNPNITISGKNPPTSTAGAHAAVSLKNVKNVARYPPKIEPLVQVQRMLKHP